MQLPAENWVKDINLKIIINLGFFGYFRFFNKLIGYLLESI